MYRPIVCGLDYKSQPLALRERLSISPDCSRLALRQITALSALKEAGILSTCNRFEIYAVTDDFSVGCQQLLGFFVNLQELPAHESFAPTLFLSDEQAVAHLCRVASGLESMVLGEGQVMAQVKAAYQSSVEAGCAGASLHRLFQLALYCGKRVRTETGIATRAVSTGGAAVEVCRQQQGNLRQARMLVIGAGHAAQMCVKQLLSLKDSPAIQVVNRGWQRLEQIRDLDREGRLSLSADYESRHELVAKSDAVIVTTAAASPVLKFESLAPFSSLPQVIVDLSVPRNVDQRLAERTHLYTIDDLGNIVQDNLRERSGLCLQAEQIIDSAIVSRWAPWVVQRRLEAAAMPLQ
ncbi:MAG: glutamyl-tRNA reductase [Candidatus Obscuribacterales bacterium]